MWTGSGNGVSTSSAPFGAAAMACLVVAAAAASVAVVVAATTLATLALTGTGGGGGNSSLPALAATAANGERQVDVLLLGRGVFPHSSAECHMCNFHRLLNGSQVFDAAVVMAGEEGQEGDDDPLTMKRELGRRAELWGRLIADPERLSRSREEEEVEFDFSISYFPEASVKIFEGKFLRRPEKHRTKRSVEMHRSMPSRIVASIVDECITNSNREEFIQEVICRHGISTLYLKSPLHNCLRRQRFPFHCNNFCFRFFS